MGKILTVAKKIIEQQAKKDIEGEVYGMVRAVIGEILGINLGNRCIYLDEENFRS